VHCAANTEVDGYGLLLHRLVDALRLDAAAGDDESVRALIRTLDARRRPAAAAAPDDRRRAIAALDAEQRQSEYYDRRWLQVYCASLEKRLAAAVAERDRLQSEVAARTEAQARAEADVAEHKRRAEDLTQPVASMAQELAALLADPEGGSARSLVLLVGPEGGFSPAEAALARAAGYRPVTLGPRVLRTETAALAALAALRAIVDDFSPPAPSTPRQASSPATT
jgi:hypothetical protein